MAPQPDDANTNLYDDILSANNLAIKRPGSGISPMRWDEIIGTFATKDYVEDELI